MDETFYVKNFFSWSYCHLGRIPCACALQALARIGKLVKRF